MLPKVNKKKIKVVKLVKNLKRTIKVLSLPHSQRRSEDLQEIILILNRLPFFSDMIETNSEEIIKKCLQFMYCKTYEAHCQVFEQGSVGEKFFVIIEGQVGVYVRILMENQQTFFNQNIELLSKKNSKKSQEENSLPEENSILYSGQQCVKILDSGDCFGEMALIYNSPRLSSIITHSKCYFLILDKKKFIDILRENKKSAIQNEIRYFSTLPYFDQQDVSIWRDLFLNCIKIQTTMNSRVFSQGDISDAVYIIKSGIFEEYVTLFYEEKGDEYEEKKELFQTDLDSLFKPKAKQSVEYRISQLGSGQLFGEEDILQKKTRSFGVRCVSEKGELLQIKRVQFLNKIMSKKQTRLKIKDICLEKLLYQQNQINNSKEMINQYSSYLIGDQEKIKINEAISKANNSHFSNVKKFKEKNKCLNGNYNEVINLGTLSSQDNQKCQQYCNLNIVFNENSTVEESECSQIAQNPDLQPEFKQNNNQFRQQQHTPKGNVEKPFLKRNIKMLTTCKPQTNECMRDVFSFSGKNLFMEKQIHQSQNILDRSIKPTSKSLFMLEVFKGQASHNEVKHQIQLQQKRLSRNEQEKAQPPNKYQQKKMNSLTCRVLKLISGDKQTDKWSFCKLQKCQLDILKSEADYQDTIRFTPPKLKDVSETLLTKFSHMFSNISLKNNLLNKANRAYSNKLETRLDDSTLS